MKGPLAARSFALVLFCSALVPSSGCQDRTGTYCECPAPMLVVQAPEGTTFAITGGTCTGRCQAARGLSCGDFLVEAPADTTCTVRAMRPGALTEDSQFVTFTERGCCGLLPDPLVWTVGSAPVDPEG